MDGDMPMDQYTDTRVESNTGETNNAKHITALITSTPDMELLPTPLKDGIPPPAPEHRGVNNHTGSINKQNDIHGTQLQIQK